MTTQPGERFLPHLLERKQNYFSSVMPYTSETWRAKEEDVIRLERNGARIGRWMCSARPEERISAEELSSTLKLISMRECLQDKTLKWFGHIEKE